MTDDPLAGRALIAEGREATIHEWDDGTVLRVMRSPDDAWNLAVSTAASEAARLAGVATPKVIDSIEIDGRPAQVLERVDGIDLFAHLAAKPWTLASSARMLAEVHVGLAEVEAPDDLEPTRERMRRLISASDRVPEWARDRALSVIDELPDGNGVCHGDFHPGNILLSPDGPVLIDWTGATRGDPLGDFARTRLMLRVGVLPPGAPLVVRVLTPVARGALLSLYERAYRKAQPVDDELLGRWTVAHAANRLTEGIEGEEEALLATIFDHATA